MEDIYITNPKAQQLKAEQTFKVQRENVTIVSLVFYMIEGATDDSSL